MDKRIEIGLIAFLTLIVIFLSLDKCNQQGKGDIDEIKRENRSLEIMAKDLARQNLKYLQQANLYHAKFEIDSTKLTQIKSQKVYITKKIETVKHDTVTIENLSEQVNLLEQKDSLSDIQEATCEEAIFHLSNEATHLKSVIMLSDSVIGIKGEQIQNLNDLLKKERKIARRRIIGYTLGGFTVGVGITAAVLLLKR